MEPLITVYFRCLCLLGLILEHQLKNKMPNVPKMSSYILLMKDYEDRRNRQVQGIACAKTEGKYLGRREDTEKHKIIASLLRSVHTYSEIQATAKCSRQLVAIIVKEAE